jgi:hypothetical protein
MSGVPCRATHPDRADGSRTAAAIANSCSKKVIDEGLYCGTSKNFRRASKRQLAAVPAV